MSTCWVVNKEQLLTEAETQGLRDNMPCPHQGIEAPLGAGTTQPLPSPCATREDKPFSDLPPSTLLKHEKLGKGGS